MEVVRANSYLRQVLDLDSRRILTGNGNEGNIWAKNASFQCELAQFGKYIYLYALTSDRSSYVILKHAKAHANM